MGSGGTNTLLPPGKLSEPFRSERLSIRLDRKAYLIGCCVCLNLTQNVWVLYGQASRAISTG